MTKSVSRRREGLRRLGIDTRVVTIKIPCSFQQSEVVVSDLQNEEKKSVGNSKKKTKKKREIKTVTYRFGAKKQWQKFVVCNEL